MRNFLQSAKAKLLAFVGVATVGAVSAQAAVLTPTQLTEVTDAVTAGIGEYVVFILALIVITYPAMLIIKSLRSVGRGRSS